jgi:hypothetical protein
MTKTLTSKIAHKSRSKERSNPYSKKQQKHNKKPTNNYNSRGEKSNRFQGGEEWHNTVEGR